MENSRFSTLIYRIIGKPERWHDDYIDVMNQVLDETESFDELSNFSELAVGDQILNQIHGTNEALTAFNTLLNESRFKMIILDHETTPIYHNQNASDLYEEFVAPNTEDNKAKLKPGLKNLVSEAVSSISSSPSGLTALKAFDINGDQLYLRSINSRNGGSPNATTFYLLLVLDQNRQTDLLNSEFLSQYELTQKEQNVLLKLIHGRNVKEAAAELFVSDNTVKTHLKSIFRKTESKSQADVVRLALTHESQVLDSYFDPGSADLASIVNNAVEDKTVTLKNGLRIAYREYGPENGAPIVICHNGYGCRIMVPHNYEAVLQEQQKRLIIPDRPGTGKTPFQKGHPESWNDNLQEFIDELQLGEYEILGVVMGSVFALLHAMTADERLKRVHLISPVFVNTRKDMDYLLGIFAPSARLIRASKRFALEIYELWLKSVSMNLGTHYRSMVEKSLGSKEREKLVNEGNLEKNLNLMVECFKEGLSQTVEGISRDMVYCISPRKIDLAKIDVPVELWWGTEDNRVSREGVENLANQLNTSNLHIHEGFSEHIYYSLFEEILEK